ncbi:CRISPR-associated protein Cas4 [Terrisporobacter mayombei]|uniref:CRISPR-associated exonuclease Cas4 n=1 Tax=Terrisporobacter mayombei TaxID=1541 RepID=A0ABY9PYJ7_9FIRM|nr:CRISPR-associated protein Cas4 [Terrisporobacter mayombei]MCC3867945.1 CRISPR-associated protein Cas4 [Terrisporobacter mayombei]WMT80079.1 CRISPR-associated exonuclease Cas4 [Terrisporobacter mayombei]
MKSSQNSFDEFEYYITPSDMIEFLYCKRFIYYMKSLDIPQFEERRFKVQKGKEVHEKKETQNKQYLRKKLGVVDKKIDVDLYSEKFKIKGIVDEVVTLEDGSMAPLDYKFAKYDEVIYKTYRSQMLLYSLMIKEMYNCEVNKSFIVYSRSKNLVKGIEINENDLEKLKKNINEYFKVVKGYFPKATSSKSRCIDCCYKNICIK